MNNAPEEMHEASLLEAKVALADCEGFLLMTFGQAEEEKMNCGMYFSTGEFPMQAVWQAIYWQMRTLLTRVAEWQEEDVEFEIDRMLEELLGSDGTE